jgi:tetratricopeptide (TPR) repeat protein
VERQTWKSDAVMDDPAPEKSWAGLPSWYRVGVGMGAQSWGVCESLIASSRACRYHDPEKMVMLAERAVSVAEDLDPMQYGPEMVADMQARTLAELANAHRVSDNLEAAERTMRRAIEASSRGTQDPLLLARIMDLTASLLGSQRKFQEALSLVDTVYVLYERHGDRHNAGRALISKGLYCGYSNDPEQAVRLVSAGLSMIDPANDPKLVISAVHNLIAFLADSGRFREARRLLRQSRKAYFAEGDRLALLKLHWLQGRIAVGLGQLRLAEKSLRWVKRELEQAGLDYNAALVSLDLAVVWLRRGKTAATRRLIEEIVTLFQARGIAREALAALLLLKETFADNDSDSLDLLNAVREYLKRLETRPRFKRAYLRAL